MGDGSKVSFWNDKWLGSQCRLTNIIANIPDNIKDWKVKDVGGENGEWNMNIIESVFPCQIRDKMMSILPPHIENGVDVRNWEGTNNGIFTRLLVRINGSMYMLKIIPIAHVKLPTKEYCSKWTNQSQSCHLCNGTSEIVLHVLRDCQAATFVWRHLIPVAFWNVFFDG
ncbi:putative ribonuclease H protein, partial [Trifolium medium]|nr:putative ribonuclease H protein [Trifolium medium]